MKKFLALSLLPALILSACQTATETPDNPNPVETPEELVLPDFESSRDTTTTSASSELEDDTGWGFAYNSANVLDLDYSTAWCRSADDKEPTITLSFPEATSLGTVGIVPGFARDEDIYMENNRAQTIEVYGDGNLIDVWNLSDDYSMHFFDLPEMGVETLSFTIADTYPGSKYDDSCIAEIDLWSDWVNTEDADAAYNYYREHKEAFALRPVSVSNGKILFAYDYYGAAPDDVVTSCGAMNTSFLTQEDSAYGSGFHYSFDGDEYGDYLGSYDEEDNRWGGWAGMTPVLSAQMGSGVTEDDELTVKWIQNSFFTWLETPQLIRSVVVNPKTCLDGTLYVSDVFEQAGMGGFTAQVLYEGRLLWSGEISLAQ